MAALRRQVEAAGGFATLIRQGERDAGTVLVVLAEKGTNRRVFERMPHAAGGREWHCSKTEAPDNPRELDEWLERRHQRDPDLWMIELDVAQGERFIGLEG